MQETGKIKLRFARIILTIAASVFTFQTAVMPAYAYTENDLREAVGLGRMTTDRIDASLQSAVAKLAREEDYNEVVKEVKANGLDTYIDEDSVKAEKKAYKKMMDDFRSGKEAPDVITDFSDYDSYADADYDDLLYGGEDPTIADTSSLKDKIARLKKLRKIAKDKTDIGNVGGKLSWAVKGECLLSGVSRKAVRIKTKKNEKIYSLFNGSILDIEASNLTESAGVTIRVTYEGIKPVVTAGSKVRHKQVIGKAKGHSVRVTMTINGQYVNPLLAYGDKGSDIYDGYISENPWTKEILDFTEVYDKVKNSNKKKKKKSSGSYMYDNGTKKEIKNDTPAQSKKKYLYTGDPFSKIEGQDDAKAEKAVNK